MNPEKSLDFLPIILLAVAGFFLFGCAAFAAPNNIIILPGDQNISDLNGLTLAEANLLYWTLAATNDPPTADWNMGNKSFLGVNEVRGYSSIFIRDVTNDSIFTATDTFISMSQGENGFTISESTGNASLQVGALDMSNNPIINIGNAGTDFTANGSLKSAADVNAVRFCFPDGNCFTSIVTSGSGTPGGADTQVQFNDANTFGADANFTFNKTTDTLVVKNFSALNDSNALRFCSSDGNCFVAYGTFLRLDQIANAQVVTSDVNFTGVTNYRSLVGVNITSYIGTTSTIRQIGNSAGVDDYDLSPTTAGQRIRNTTDSINDMVCDDTTHICTFVGIHSDGNIGVGLDIVPDNNNVSRVGTEDKKFSDSWVINAHVGDLIFSNGMRISEPDQNTVCMYAPYNSCVQTCDKSEMIDCQLILPNGRIDPACYAICIDEMELGKICPKAPPNPAPIGCFNTQRGGFFSNNIFPDVNGSIGDEDSRFLNGYFTNVFTGDLIFSNGMYLHEPDVNSVCMYKPNGQSIMCMTVNGVSMNANPSDWNTSTGGTQIFGAVNGFSCTDVCSSHGLACYQSVTLVGVAGLCNATSGDRTCWCE